MALNTTMSKELETLRDMKKDLNETCLISEDRMVAAEKAYSALRNKHETDTEAHGKQVRAEGTIMCIFFGVLSICLQSIFYLFY